MGILQTSGIHISKLKLLKRWCDWFGLPMSLVNFLLVVGRIKFSVFEASHKNSYNFAFFIISE